MIYETVNETVTQLPLTPPDTDPAPFIWFLIFGILALVLMARFYFMYVRGVPGNLAGFDEDTEETPEDSPEETPEDSPGG